MANLIKVGCDKDILLRCLMETVHQGITVFDTNLDLMAANETAMHLLDIPFEMFSTFPNLEDIFRYNARRGDYGPGDLEDLVRERVETTLKFEAHDFERVRPDGTILRIQGTPLEGVGFVTIYSDVTHDREQERELLAARMELSKRLDDRNRELEASRDLLLNAINAISDGLGISNTDGRIILANDKMREIYPETDTGMANDRSVMDVIRHAFPDEENMGADRLDEPSFRWQEKFFPNGKWYRIKRSLSSDGGVISVYSDITEYKKQQKNLQKHTDELVRLLQQEKNLSEMQREFVSMASHEFRTPLAIIDSNAQRLKRQVDTITPEKLLDRIERIRDSVSRMQYLINRFLTFSQTQSTGMEVDMRHQPFRDVVRTCCEEFADSCSSHSVVVDVEELPEMLDYDQKLMELCVSNLLSNAVKYSPSASQVNVKGRSCRSFIAIEVEDSGVGIPEEEIPKIFDRYFRASTSSGIAGTGIGLNMVAKVVEGHNGKIKVASKLGEGSRISIRLPVVEKKTEPKSVSAV